MTEVRHQEFINRPTPFVFAAGLDTSLWPELEKLDLETRAALLSHGTDIHATVTELGQRIGVPCTVTELDEGEHLAFEGESDRARLYLGLDFKPHGRSDEATQVEGVLKLKITDFKLRIALGGIVSHVAKNHLKNFGQGFKTNIEALPEDYAFPQILQAS